MTKWSVRQQGRQSEWESSQNYFRNFLNGKQWWLAPWWTDVPPQLFCQKKGVYEGMEPKLKQYPVVDVTSDRSKVRCCKEQYCIGTWNVMSVNQGKLEVVKPLVIKTIPMVKQEMARVNIDILGISKLKWTGMGEFNSDDHYVYSCGQESLRRNGVAITFKYCISDSFVDHDGYSISSKGFLPQ